MTLRLGSLCSGAGMLDLALAQVLDVETVWHAENDPHAARVLAHHWPDVPNHGDLTTVDWATVEPVDVVCFGFPCQDLSYAGRGAGITEGTRSGLWTACWDAVRVLRPRLVVVENVAALLARRPGFDVVIADMAADGYDARWTCLRASDVGAPHRRERVFVAAADADCAGAGRDGRAIPRQAEIARRAGPVVRAAVDARAAAADAERPGRQGARHRPGRRPEPARAGSPAAPHSDGQRLAWRPEHDGEPLGREADDQPRRYDPRGLGGPAWGVYGPAIARWERIIDRTPPAPVDDAGRLSPLFVEWMLGLPAGWVTDVPGVPRTAQLRVLGNGVVPQQGAVALSSLLAPPRLAAGRRMTRPRPAVAPPAPHTPAPEPTTTTPET